VKVALAVTGCIGAYKAALILRILQNKGVEIIPVMTSSAARFLAPLTMEKLSGRKVFSDLFDGDSADIEHISVAREIDLLLVAPATANTLAKFASGLADDFLSTLYVSAAVPVVLAPAMNVEMWKHPATQANVEVLRERGAVVVEPSSGYQACGEYGEGRLADPERICAVVMDSLKLDRSLESKKVLVTAGPTAEDIDPVRFITNRSSGRMGYAMAREAVDRGAEVHLISGPTALDPPAGVVVSRVRTAAEMANAVFDLFGEIDILIKAAAVSDFTPAENRAQKLKKTKENLALELVRTTDILAELGRRKRDQILVGFAAESENLRENARVKLEAKSLDLIVANDISKPGSGFASEMNRVVLIDALGAEEELPLLAKTEVAARVWDKVEELLSRQKTPVSQDEK